METLPDKDVNTHNPVLPSLDLSRIPSEHQYALEENIPAIGHHQETNLLIGKISQTQFNQMTKDRDDAAIVHKPGDMKNRAKILPKDQTQKVVSYATVLTSNTSRWVNFVENNLKESNLLAARQRQIDSLHEYWGEVKTNFVDMLKKLSQHFT